MPAKADLRRTKPIENSCDYRMRMGTDRRYVWQSSPVVVKNPQKRLNISVLSIAYLAARSGTWRSLLKLQPRTCLRGRWFDSHQTQPYNATSVQHNEGAAHVIYVSATLQFEEEARAWLQKTHEYQERPKSVGSPPGKRACPFDGLGPFLSASAQVLQGFSSRPFSIWEAFLQHDAVR